jgi:hypothetical protein
VIRPNDAVRRNVHRETPPRTARGRAPPRRSPKASHDPTVPKSGALHGIFPRRWRRGQISLMILTAREDTLLLDSGDQSLMRGYCGTKPKPGLRGGELERHRLDRLSMPETKGRRSGGPQEVGLKFRAGHAGLRPEASPELSRGRRRQSAEDNKSDHLAFRRSSVEKETCPSAEPWPPTADFNCLETVDDGSRKPRVHRKQRHWAIRIFHHEYSLYSTFFFHQRLPLRIVCLSFPIREATARKTAPAPPNIATTSPTPLDTQSANAVPALSIP